MAESSVVLKPGREKSVRQGHPWIFGGAIAHLPAECADGGIVEVLDHRREWLARGYLNRRSQITVRLLTWRADEPIDEAFWRVRLAAAIRRRAELAASATDVYRLVHAESDFIPGLTVDRYGDCLVLQAGALAIDERKTLLAELLVELTGCRAVVERSDMGVRRLEGLSQTSGLLAGSLAERRVTVCEDGLRFVVDLLGGQKSGFYADQRQNRRRVAAHCADKRLLNAFAYTGAFAVHALAAGARHVVNLDSSVEALELCETNLALNGFDVEAQSENVAGDVFRILRDWAAEDHPPRFDVIVLDPPKFAHNKQGVERALRGYKEINRLALRLLEPDGLLATFSCSGLVESALFQKVLFGAALDAHRSVQILEWFHQASDHPVALTFPEGHYLKGLLCRVLE